jgi:hypothetical protein
MVYRIVFLFTTNKVNDEIFKIKKNIAYTILNILPNISREDILKLVV